MQQNSNQLTEEQIAMMGAILVGALVFLAIWSLIKIFLLNIVEVGCHNLFKNNHTRAALYLELKNEQNQDADVVTE